MTTLLEEKEEIRRESTARPETVLEQEPGRSQGTRSIEWSEHLYKTRIKSTDLILFSTQLAVMLDSGVILSDALDAIAEQAGDARFKAIILDVSERVKSGDTFSRALAYYPRIFDPMFISMVQASEASGKMVEMLSVLTGYLSFEAETRKRVLGALTYPLIMVLMAIAATGTLMFFVLPRFMRIYESRGAALPKLTQVLVFVSRIIGDTEMLMGIVTTVVVLGIFLAYWAHSATGRRVIDALKIRTPVHRYGRDAQHAYHGNHGQYGCAAARRDPRHRRMHRQLLLPATLDPGR